MTGLKYLEYISRIRTENTLNNLNTEQKHQIEQKHSVEQKALNRKNTEANKSQTIKTGNNNTTTDQNSVVKKKLNCDCPILAGIKYLCDYCTDNCNPVCLNVKYEKSNTLMRASLPSQRAHKLPFENSQKST
jgi:hypothetical protein